MIIKQIVEKVSKILDTQLDPRHHQLKWQATIVGGIIFTLDVCQSPKIVNYEIHSETTTFQIRRQ